MGMDIFEVTDLDLKLNDPVAIAILQPWVDVGKVGSIVLDELQRHLGAKELARLARPGSFFDFTRYRPEMRMVDGKRDFIIPNTFIFYGSDSESGRNYILLNLREPHANAEDYTDAIVELLQYFGVSEYCRIGGMTDSVPHTRSLTVTATLSDEQADRAKGLVSTRSSGYQGPTSVVNRVTECMDQKGIPTASLMVHMPQYVQLEEDYMGAYRLMQVLCVTYDLPVSLSNPVRGEQQYREITQLAERNPQIQGLIEQLEARYDQGRIVEDEAREKASFPPDVEDFLREMGQRLESPLDDD